MKCNQTQCYLLNADQFNENKDQYPRLIPSKEFQEKRFQIFQCLFNDRKNLSKKQKFFKSKWKEIEEKNLNIHCYELVQWFIPKSTCKCPLIFVAIADIGRHQLRESLINSK